MPNLHPAYSAVRSFADFMDAYKANMEAGIAPRATRNDLVRCWNILGVISTSPTNHYDVAYATINVSQSSIRTTVSKLNQIFYHLGVATARHGLRITQESFYRATIYTGTIDTSVVLDWNLGTVVETSGRRQDRVDTRHENGHRRRRNGQTAPIFEGGSISGLSDVASALADLSAMLSDFDAFAGVDSSVFLTLESEIDAA